MRTHRSSKELLDKMRACVDSMEKELRNDALPADVQIENIGFLCWAMVELALRVQQSVRDELSDLDDG